MSSSVRWRSCITPDVSSAAAHSPYLIGVLEGEGIGPDIVPASLQVLEAVAQITGDVFTIEHGGAIGRDAERVHGVPLSEEVAAFCEGVFAQNGAILAGAGGGRFVYDLRRQFDMFCKFSPLVSSRTLAGAGCLKPEHREGLDLVIVRENTGGIYQGAWTLDEPTPDDRSASHSFAYSAQQVTRILEVAARLAQQRRGELAVIHKEAGLPSVSTLWKLCGDPVADAYGIAVRYVDIDLAAYQLIQHPRSFDVIVTPNLFGDIMSDVGAVLVGSRGLTFSGNFTPEGHGVYQTNHGAAYDLVGKDVGNPVGQILSLAMLLRESFGLLYAASLIEAAVEQVWKDGWRTADLAEPNCQTIGTRHLTDLITEAVPRVHQQFRPHDPLAATG